MKRPHIIYWKWNDELLNLNTVRNRTKDLIQRSIFDVIYISLHSMSHEHSILCSDEVCRSLKVCCDILRENGRKLVLDLDIRKELHFLKLNPPKEKDIMTRYMEGQLDENGSLTVRLEKSNGILSCKCVDFDAEGFFIEDSMEDITEFAFGSNETIKIDAGKGYANKHIIYFPIKNFNGYDICGDEYKIYREQMFQRVANIGLSGAATDEWGEPLDLEYELEESADFKEGDSQIKKVYSLIEMGYDAETLPFILNWFHVSEGLCKYYKIDWGTELIDDLVWFRNSSRDINKGIRIVNQYVSTLKKRILDGDATFYDLTKKYFGQDAMVMCHPTWWGDEFNSNFEILRNGLDWWEVKRDFAQTDEQIQIPVRMSMARKCKENFWYNMWYSMRTMDIKTYYRETWINARYGGRTHHLGYECYEPGVVLTLKEPGRLESISEMESEIEKLNHVQTSRPDARVLLIFGYEAVSNWKIAEPECKHWKRSAEMFTKVWKFTKALFDKHYLCEAIPSSEIDNGSARVINGKMCYCGHDYDAVILLYPIEMTDRAKQVINECSVGTSSLAVVGDRNKEFNHIDAFSLEEPDVDEIYKWLEKEKVKRNCGDNYCIYEDGSILFTTDGKENVNNSLEISTDINDFHIEFKGKDFLYLNLQNEIITYGSKDYLQINNQRIL